MIKTSRKHVRIFLSVLLAGLFAGILLANLSAFRNIDANSCEGESGRTMGSLTSDTPYQQYFVPVRQNLSFIEVRIATYVKENAKGTIQFVLMNSKGKIISQSDVAIKDLQDDSYYRFAVNAKLNTSKTYSYTLRAVDTGWDKAPVVWVSSPSKQEESTLVLPGVSKDKQYQTEALYGYSYFNIGALVGCAALILACGLGFYFQPNLSGKQRTAAGIAALLFVPVGMFFLAEALNDNSAMVKRAQVYPLNFLCYLLLYLITFALVNRLRISMIFMNTVIYILAVINYFKLQFRGEPLQPWDLFSAKTAMNVSSSYQMTLSVVLVYTFLFFVLMNLLVAKIDFSMPRIRTRILLGAASVALSAFLVLSLFGTDRYSVAAFNFMQKMGITNNVWNQTSNYEQNGLVVAFTMNAQFMNVVKPSGYDVGSISDMKMVIEYGSVDNAVTVLAKKSAEAASLLMLPTASPVPPEGVPTETPITEDTVVKPNIIAIMCESYANLTQLDDYITNKEVTPFYDNVSDNAIKGSMYVSTYGGGTANTEFEFLTGNTMAFLPAGSIPYQQYITSPTGSLARILKGDGYETIAVHPFVASGWNRPEVYSDFGFDKFLSMDDFLTPAYERAYISDASSYSKLIELYENKPKGQPIFLFNVTMQNHGGYTTEYPNFVEDVTLPDYPGQFPETEQYLSLIHSSDEALKNLVDYFANADEPTVICFFGDHLPNLKNNFYKTILGKSLSDLSPDEMLNLYKTPFLIWANYDIPEQEIDKISANYMSTLLLQTANIDLPDYNSYLSSLYQYFPVISGRAVIDAEGNTYQSYKSVPNNEMIKQYAILAYNNLFDKNNRDATLFDSAPSSASEEGIMITGLPAVDPLREEGASTIGGPTPTIGTPVVAAVTGTPAA